MMHPHRSWAHSSLQYSYFPLRYSYFLLRYSYSPFLPPGRSESDFRPKIDDRSRCDIGIPSLGELPSKDEIDYAIARAACEKSPGVDGVPIEAYKIIRESDELFEVFTDFVHAYWREAEVDPEPFHTTVMSLLPKN